MQNIWWKFDDQTWNFITQFTQIKYLPATSFSFSCNWSTASSAIVGGFELSPEQEILTSLPAAPEIQTKWKHGYFNRNLGEHLGDFSNLAKSFTKYIKDPAILK